MIASEACVDLIKRSEGFRMRPYADPAGLLTIGYGHKCCAAVGIVTEDEADLLLRRDLANVEEQVSSIVKVPLTQGQFDALCDFTFNLGYGRLASSTLLKVLNAGNYAAAAAEFPKWDLCSGEPSPGLYRRRMAERQMFERAA